MVTEVNLAPTDEGYGKILALFCASILSTSLRRKRKAVAQQLLMVIEVAAYLGSTSPSELKLAKATLESEKER
jgi:hypothetical protein